MDPGVGLLQRLVELEAIHPGHMQVAQDNVNRFPLEMGQPGLTIASFKDSPPALAKLERQIFPLGIIIFYIQNIEALHGQDRHKGIILLLLTGSI